MENKKWYASKTIWVNALALAGSLALAFIPNMTAETWAGLSTTGLAVVNVILRFITKEEIVW